MVVDIIALASTLTALGVIMGVAIKAFKWFTKQEKQDTDIKGLKRENALICYALLACLDGLEQLGANHTVPIAKEKLNEHLNEQAHNL